MKKVSDLLDAINLVITNMRNLADSMQEVADVLTESKPKRESTSKNPKKEKVKTYTLEDVRAVLAEKSQNGLTAEVKNLISKFGGNKLSDINPENYAEVIKAAEVLGNE